MLVRVTVSAGAKKQRIVEIKKQYFEISVREPAERNEANRKILQLLAKWYDIDEGSVYQRTGHRSPKKTFDITLVG